MRLTWGLLALALGACDRGEPPSDKPPLLCVPGETRSCVGPSGCKGGQACKADGSGYDPCDCGDLASSEPRTVAPAPPPPAESRKAQCARLLEAINEGNAALGQGGRSQSPAAGLRANATALERTVAKLKAFTFTDTAVAELRDEYAKLAADLAVASEATAKGIEGGKPAAALSATQTMGDYDAREKAFTQRVAELCSDPPSGAR